ncbi:MAG: hypothetical protein AAFY26_18600 [Cyanobacteria bacterium J06638_22]
MANFAPTAATLVARVLFGTGIRHGSGSWEWAIAARVAVELTRWSPTPSKQNPVSQTKL